MEKNFAKWQILKEKIERTPATAIPKNGDIWWYYEGVNIGEEISKDTFLRPCIVLAEKCGRNMCMIAPCTSVVPTGKTVEYAIHIDTWYRYGLSRASYILLNQIRHIDYRRLHKSISKNPITKGFLKKIWIEICKKYTPE